MGIVPCQLSEPAPPSDIPDLPSFESAQSYGEEEPDITSTMPNVEQHHDDPDRVSLRW